MSAWLMSNWGSIIVVMVLAVIIALIIIKMVKDKKSGKTSCGCACSNCAMRDSCHSNKN